MSVISFLRRVMTYGLLIFLLSTHSVQTGICYQSNTSFRSSMVSPAEKESLMPVPDGVEIGDLMLLDLRLDQANQWKRPGFYNEHGALFVGNNTLIEANGAVRYRNFSQLGQWCKNYIILRVKTANESQRRFAVEWAKSRIGAPYQVFFDFPWFGLKIADTRRKIPTADELYCVELLWAAYYVQGIDLDRNGWSFPWWITPNDILYDDDVEVLYRDVTNSTEIVKPDKGVYIANRKIICTVFDTFVIGPINIEVVTENKMITKIEFYIDSVYRATDTTPPYTWRWDEKGFGDKVIKAVAYDDTNNYYSSVITVRKFF